MDEMNGYHVSFVTTHEAPNPFKAARLARQEIDNGAALIVTNELTDRAYAVYTEEGFINCPECGVDTNDDPSPDCRNCNLPRD